LDNWVANHRKPVEIRAKAPFEKPVYFLTAQFAERRPIEGAVG